MTVFERTYELFSAWMSDRCNAGIEVGVDESGEEWQACREMALREKKYDGVPLW